MDDTYIVYVQTDSSGNITAVNSSAFLPDTTGWTQIDSGAGDKYHHAQSNYFPLPLMTNDGIYRYKLAGGAVAAKTDAEIAAEALPAVQAAAIAAINQACADRINAGYYSYAEGSKNSSGAAVALLYKSDASHQSDMGMELYLAQQHKAGNLMAYACTWKDASIDGPCHAVSDDAIIQLYTEMGVHILWCKTTADTLVAAVQAATTTAAISTTWPTEPAPTAPTAS